MEMKMPDSLKKLTRKFMYDYISENDPNNLKAFTKAVIEKQYPKKKKPVLDENGEPVMKEHQITKDGKKTGKYVMRPIVEMVDDTTKAKKPVYQSLKAQRLFASKYAPHLLKDKEETKEENEFMKLYLEMDEE